MIEQAQIYKLFKEFREERIIWCGPKTGKWWVRLRKGTSVPFRTKRKAVEYVLRERALLVLENRSA